MSKTTNTSIIDYFTPTMHQADGSVKMLDLQDEPRSRLYILNSKGKKLLQLAVKNEPTQNDSSTFAQLKLIPYGLRKAQIWRNSPSDPQQTRLSNAWEYELTYHGTGNQNQAPKIHLIEKRRGQKEYTTLIDMTLPLSQELFRFVPLFSMNPGFANAQLATEEVKKKAHVFHITEGSVQLDFYISGSEAEIQLAFNTHHGLSLFFALDYLCTKKQGVLKPVIIAMPISGFRMGNYRIWVRCSLSDYSGRPMMQFYQNSRYYESFANRPIAWPDGQGGFSWSNIAEEDARTVQNTRETLSKK